MLEIRNLAHTFNLGTPIENVVLRGIDLDINPGDFITVIGSNGAGKSTLLNSLAGEIIPLKGSIRLNGEDITRQAAHQRAAHVARVFQDPLAGTCGNLTILENMALALKRGKKRSLAKAFVKQDIHRIQRALHHLDLGLENRLDDKIGLLSGGQRQAVSLLMATLQPTQLLLLDEHTAALDPKTAAFVLALTNKIVSTNQLTTLMVTHSMQQALDVGNRTIMLHQGRVVVDVSGEQRAKLGVKDLLDLFERTRGEKISDDALLLG